MSRLNSNDAQFFDPRVVKGLKYGVLTQTLGANLTMDADMPVVLELDPGGSGRDVLLPAEAAGLAFFIVNTADNPEVLTVKEDSDTTTIGALGEGEAAWFICGGSTWRMGLVMRGGGVTALTENSTGIGGTNDGDIPDLTAVAAALTENSTGIGGTNDGDLPDLTASAAALTENSTGLGGSQDGDITSLVDPSGDAGASLIDGVRECAAMINSLVTDVNALRAAVRENSTMINSLVTDDVALRAGVREDAAKINELIA